MGMEMGMGAMMMLGWEKKDRRRVNFDEKARNQEPAGSQQRRCVEFTTQLLGKVANSASRTFLTSLISVEL